MSPGLRRAGAFVALRRLRGVTARRVAVAVRLRWVGVGVARRVLPLLRGLCDRANDLRRLPPKPAAICAGVNLRRLVVRELVLVFRRGWAGFANVVRRVNSAMWF